MYYIKEIAETYYICIQFNILFRWNKSCPAVYIQFCAVFLHRVIHRVYPVLRLQSVELKPLSYYKLPINVIGQVIVMQGILFSSILYEH